MHRNEHPKIGVPTLHALSVAFWVEGWLDREGFGGYFGPFVCKVRIARSGLLLFVAFFIERFAGLLCQNVAVSLYFLPIALPGG